MPRPNSDISGGISSHNNDKSGYGVGVKKLRVPEAAHVLGISPEAVRNRLSRGKLRSTKEGSTVFVLLDPDITEDSSEGISGLNKDMPKATEVLLAAKDETIRTLREQLEAERESARRKDTILMTMAQRIPELEPAQETAGEPREPHERGSEEPGRDQGNPERQEPVERRSWLHRVLFGP